MAPRTAAPRAACQGGSQLRIPALSVAAVLFAISVVPAAADFARGWLVNVASKQDAHQHTHRMMLQHEEQGHELMRSWFSDWKGYFAREYASEEAERKAFIAFQGNLHMVHTINTNPNLTFWASGNRFSDMTWDEFKRQQLAHKPFNGTTPSDHPGSVQGVDVHEEADDDVDGPQEQQQEQGATGRRLLQSTWDWRSKGIVTPVRDQGSCNACWVMAGIHAMEAAYMINEATTTPVQLSAQQALDCYGVGSCNWGDAAQMMYHATFQPLTTEDNYPLFSDKTGVNGPCQTDRINAAANGNEVELAGGTGYERLQGGPEDLLVTKTMVNPVIMHYEVDIQFMQYAGGVYSAQSCSGDNLNHALVAYGFDRGAGWWLFKNSWGANWGDGGYVRVAMVGGTGTCGLYKWAFRPSRYFSRRLSKFGARPLGGRRMVA